MKIDYVIVSSDDNPTYYEFWDVVKKLWVNLVGIKPILVRIGNEDKITDYGDCIVHEIKKIDGIDTGFQSQISRMYVTKFYSEYVCLTSDIDMLPLSKTYFTKDIKDYDNNSILIFSSDAYNSEKRYPICYNASKGKFFNEILDLNVDFKEYCLRLLKMNKGWDTDELYFGMKISEYKNQEQIIKLKRQWNYGIANKRIDRSYWGYDINLLKNNFYIDCHSLRPYSNYRNIIDNLINELI
jgi:hypothetical protein